MRTTNLSLEGLRGAAALLVVFFHAHFWVSWLDATQNGYLAVDLFFVLSGFVISTAYSAKLDDAGEARAFIVRRFGRIWPVFVVATAMQYLVTDSLLASMTRAGHYYPLDIPSSGETVALVTMSQGLNLFDRYIGNGSAWSAGDEFYIYLLFGAMCLALHGKARIAAFAATAAAGYALAIWVSVGPSHCLRTGSCFDMTYSFGWARCLVGFFGGALIAEYRGAALFRALRGRFAQIAIFAASVGFVVYADRAPGLALAAPVVFVALIASLTEDRGAVAALFSMRPFQYLGRVSYSLYLTHAVFLQAFGSVVNAQHSFTMQAVGIAAFLVFTFFITQLVHVAVEVPFRARFYGWAGRLRERAPSVVVD
ncbi:acyltransferase family protein [Burkholderia sp. PU8-34]